MTRANNNSSKNLPTQNRVTSARLNHPRVTPPRDSLYPNNLPPEPDQPDKPELVRELVQKPQHLLVTRKSPRVPIRTVRKWVVEKAHELPRQVGPEGAVEARVHHLPVRIRADRIGVDPLVVAPRASEVVAFLKHDDVEALAAELSSDGESGDASADDGDSDRVRHCDGERCVMVV